LAEKFEVKVCKREEELEMKEQRVKIKEADALLVKERY
jgi:hypothetical protein